MTDNDSNKKSAEASSGNKHREPILQQRDSLDKVIKVIDSRSFTKQQQQQQPSLSSSQCGAASLPKDKLILNSETLLILNLLGMRSEIREQYLIEVAKQRKLLLTNTKTNTFNVNPDLFDVNNVPQVVDFVHQFHGKPIAADSEVPGNLTRKLRQRVKKKEKEKKPVRTMVFENQKMVDTSEPNVQSTVAERSNKAASDRGSVPNVAVIASVQQQQKSNPFVQKESAKASDPLKTSFQSASMSHLNKIMDKHNKKPRTLSACEQAVSRVLRQVDAHRQNGDEEFSKAQQKRLRKKLRALSLECTMQANAEKPPRKRGSRGSKKVADPLMANQPQSNSVVQQPGTLSTASIPKTDVAAKNHIRNKCSQINVKIQEKLNLCSTSTMKAGPSTSTLLHQTDDLVVESIASGSKSDDDDNDYSSVSSDSSNFPNDEETTSYFAKSDEMESSCNEKRNEKRTVKAAAAATGAVKKSVLKEDVTPVSSQ